MFRTRATLTATAVGAAAAAALAVTVLPATAAVADASAARSVTGHDGPRAASDSPSPSDTQSPSSGAPASGSPSDSPSASASPPAGPTATPYPAGAPILTMTVPSKAQTGGLIQLSGRVLGPDGKPAPAQTPVVIRAQPYNHSFKQAFGPTTVVDQPIVALDGRFTSVLPITRSTYFSAQAVNVGSGHDEKVTTRPSLVTVKSVIASVAMRIIGGRLVVKAALIPGQQVKVDKLYAIATLSLATKSGVVIRKLMEAAVTMPPRNGRHVFSFRPVPLPPAGSFVVIKVFATQTALGMTKALKVPVIYVPPTRHSGGTGTPTTPGTKAPSPSASPGVHSVF